MNLIFIKILFGHKDLYDRKWRNRHHPLQEAKNDLDRPGMKDVFYYFVLGENNKEFLLNVGVPENKIILVDKRTNIEPEGVSPLYNKVFLLKCAAEMFAGKDILYTDTDCNLIRDLNTKEIYSSLESKNEVVQCPVVYYSRSIFRSINNHNQRHGLQTCLVYWKDPDIIKKWFDFQIKYPSRWGDEPPLVRLLEEMYGALSVPDLARFDPLIVRTNHRPTGDLFCPEKYENAYFFHN